MDTWTVPAYAEGQAVSGYTERRELGRGASGRVVEAVHDESGRPVAIKYLDRGLVQDPAFLRGLRAETEKLRKLSVPQVVRVYDYVEQPNYRAAVVMELVDGVSLHDMIERRGPLGPQAALTVLKDSLLGLGAAHALGIVHRDVKPENVLIDADGNSKLTDFGIAVRWGKQVPVAGTPLYLAPEQWQGAPAGPATDFYAAAAVCYECLNSSTPFSGEVQELREQHVTAAVPLDRIDPVIADLVARGMAKNPADRPQSAIAFVSELEAAALAAYGPRWEDEGRAEVAARAAELPPLLAAGPAAGSPSRSYAPPPAGGGSRGRRRLVVAAVAAIAVIGGAAAAVALRGHSHGAASMARLSSPAASATAKPAPATRPVTAPPSTAGPARPRPATAPMTPLPASSASAAAAALRLASNAPPTATAGAAYSGLITVTGGQGPYTWAPVSGLPAGMTATPAGATLTLGGTPAAAGSFPLTLQVTDGSAPKQTVTEHLTLTVSPAQAAMSFVSSFSGTAMLGTPANLGGSVQGGQGPYTWTVTGLPPGLVTTPGNQGATLVITGTPAKAGMFEFTVTVTDSGPAARTLTGNFSMTVSPQPWTIATTALPDGTVGTAYSAALAGTGNVAITWSATGLPAGLSIDPVTGQISGTPKAAVTRTVYVIAKVTQAGAGTTRKAATYSLTIKAALSRRAASPARTDSR